MPSRVLWDVKEAARALDVSNLGWPLLDAWLAGGNLELYKQVRGPANTTGRLPARVRNLLWRCCWLAHCFDTIIRDSYLRVLVLASLEPPDRALVATMCAEGHDAFELCAGHWVDRLARSCMLQLPCQNQCIRTVHEDGQWTEDHVLKPHFMNKVIFEEIVASSIHGKQRVDDCRGPQWYVRCKDSARRATDAETHRILRKKAKPTESPRSTQSNQGPTKAGAPTKQLEPVHNKRVPTSAPETKMNSKKKMSSNVNWLQADDFDDGHDWGEDYFNEDDY